MFKVTIEFNFQLPIFFLQTTIEENNGPTETLSEARLMLRKMLR